MHAYTITPDPVGGLWTVKGARVLWKWWHYNILTQLHGNLPWRSVCVCPLCIYCIDIQCMGMLEEVSVCACGCIRRLNDQCNWWKYSPAETKQARHTHVCMLSFHRCFFLCFSFLFLIFSTHIFTLSLYASLQLLQYLNLHFPPPTRHLSCLSHIILLSLFLLFRFFCPSWPLFATFPTHFTPPSICWSLVLREWERVSCVTDFSDRRSFMFLFSMLRSYVSF